MIPQDWRVCRRCCNSITRRWVVVELGGNNDGLRGLRPCAKPNRRYVKFIFCDGEKPPMPNRYRCKFICPLTTVAVIMNPLAPFILSSPKSSIFFCYRFYGRGISETAVMQDDGIHPNPHAQPFIADWMAKQLDPFLLNNSSCMKRARKSNFREHRYHADLE
ncbi:hypothetical protein KCP76_16405 [Salmonella enterica subsp. enterica serovar Weltevreden]|nr:hypothetical protein KCP76_16405 [Salmonella enterica subsp. enterica serovar Weltevreden]